jgi:hypothetical protein
MRRQTTHALWNEEEEEEEEVVKKADSAKIEREICSSLSIRPYFLFFTTSLPHWLACMHQSA